MGLFLHLEGRLLTVAKVHAPSLCNNSPSLFYLHFYTSTPFDQFLYFLFAISCRAKVHMLIFPSQRVALFSFRIKAEEKRTLIFLFSVYFALTQTHLLFNDKVIILNIFDEKAFCIDMHVMHYIIVFVLIKRYVHQQISTLGSYGYSINQDFGFV